MLRKLTALVLASCVTTCFAAYDFTGSYSCKGFDPYLNKDYSGTVKITQQKSVYRLTMSYDTGEEADGTGGLYDDNTIAVVFQDTKDLKKVGLERYSLSDDGKSIQGYWVYLREDKLGTEVCTRIEEAAISDKK